MKSFLAAVAVVFGFALVAAAQYYPTGGPQVGPAAAVAVTSSTWKELVRHDAPVTGGTCELQCSYDPLFGEFCLTICESSMSCTAYVPGGAGHLTYSFTATSASMGTQTAASVTKELQPDGRYRLTATIAGVGNGNNVVKLRAKKVSGASFTFPVGSASLGTYVHVQ